MYRTVRIENAKFTTVDHAIESGYLTVARGALAYQRIATRNLTEPTHAA